MSWSDHSKLPCWHFTWEFSSESMVYEVLKWSLEVVSLALCLRILKWIDGLWCLGVMAWRCLIGTLPENSQVNRWFMMSWSDHLKLSHWHFTWEFSSKSMVYDVLKWSLEVAWLALYLRILKWIDGLWCLEVIKWSCLVGTLPENSQGSWWFMISWSDYLKLPGWHFTWEFK